MRTHGKLIKWNDERGFGFIETGAGREEIFVHISAFPHDGVRPRIGELVSFEPDQGSDGRKRAVSYWIGEDTGMIGASWGVEWCVAGLDRNWAYNPRCKMARP